MSPIAGFSGEGAGRVPGWEPGDTAVKSFDLVSVHFGEGSEQMFCDLF
jgi:hypothetical protein